MKKLVFFLLIVQSSAFIIHNCFAADIITTIAGTGTAGYSGDGGSATSARLYYPAGITLDDSGNLYIADDWNQRIRKVDTSGFITTVAGNGSIGYSGDGGQATSAQLATPRGIALDSSGNLFVAVYDSHRIRKVSTSGTITTVAGDGSAGTSGDGGSATSAGLRFPWGVTLDSSGNLYIAQYDSHVIRKVDNSGTITRFAGTSTYGYSGDGGSATSARLNSPRHVAVDSSGNLYIADSGNHRIRKVDTLGIITTVAGNGLEGYSGDGGSAISAQLDHPEGVALDSFGHLYIADSGNHRIRKVNASGIITTVAGTGVAGYSGDGGDAASVQLYGPSHVALDSFGNLYIADNNNHRIRKVTFFGIGTISGKVTKSDGVTAIAGAMVELLNGGIVKSSATTDTSGNYSMTVTTGTYDVRASASGYQTKVVSGYVVSAGATTTVDFALSEVYTDPAEKLWTKQLGTGDYEYGGGVATDGSGNIYITGETDGALDGNVSPDGGDAFLVKYDSWGNELWIRQIGIIGVVRSYAVATDSLENIYLTGETSGGLDGNTNAGSSDIFLMKYDSSGNKIWTKQLGTADNDAGMGIATDSSGNIYVTGCTLGGLDGNINVGELDIFLVKYDSSGNKIWTKQMGTTSSDFAWEVATDSLGNIYVTGVTSGGLDGNTNLGNGDIFLVKYDSSGNKIWTKQLGTAGSDAGVGIATDDAGNIYLTGSTRGELNGIVNAGYDDIFLVKYDSSGNKIWTRQLGTDSYDWAHGIASDGQGNIYVTGETLGGLDGNTNAGGRDTYLVKYDSSGNKIWTKQLGTVDNDAGMGIATDSSGNIYVTGYTWGSLNGNVNQGGSDIFLVKYGPSALPTTGTIAGKVTKSDSTTTISGAKVEAYKIEIATPVGLAMTDNSGNYSITVATGTYDVRAIASGYVTKVVSAYVVSAGSTTTVDFALLIEGISVSAVWSSSITVPTYFTDSMLNVYGIPIIVTNDGSVNETFLLGCSSATDMDMEEPRQDWSLTTSIPTTNSEFRVMTLFSSTDTVTAPSAEAFDPSLDVLNYTPQTAGSGSGRFYYTGDGGGSVLSGQSRNLWLCITPPRYTPDPSEHQFTISITAEQSLAGP
jgi:uncharacterized protein YjiK